MSRHNLKNMLHEPRSEAELTPNQTLLKNIEESVFDTYRGVFMMEDNYKVYPRTVKREEGSSNPTCEEDDAEMMIPCIAILDMCLKSEKEYPMTFWMEMIRAIESDDMELKSKMGSDRIFRMFIHYVARFNDAYGLALPRIALSNYQMHRAARYSCSRLNSDTELVKEMFVTYILVDQSEDSGDDVSSRVSGCESDSRYNGCDLGFLDDL